MIQVDLRDRRPLYEQIKENLKQLIVRGALKEGEQVPSVRELAQTLTINPNTIQRAYRDLEADGFIFTVRGKGCFVSPESEHKTEQSVSERMQALEKEVSELMYLGVPKAKITDAISRVYQEGTK